MDNTSQVSNRPLTGTSGNQKSDGTVERLAHFSQETRLLTIVLPFQAISVNSMYRAFKSRIILSAAGREWKMKAAEVIGGLKVKYDNPVAVKIEVWPKTRRAYDLDNTSKCVLDCISGPGAPIENDNLIYQMIMVKHDKDAAYPEGQVWIDIWPTST